MKTIKIFLASSEELDYDRMAFGNLVRRLDDMYEKRGIRIKLFEWEDYDSAYNDKRKQDEYNDYVKQSDIFLALFYKKAGEFTVEEFKVASQEFKDHASPKVYTYCKDLKQGEEETPELKEFKERLFNEMGHYWCRYDNRESLQFQFVMQLQLVESSQMDDVKVENGIITVNGLPVAKMENLKFAAGNDAYQKMSAELASLPEKIEKARQRVDKFPDDEDLIDDLQQKLNHYNMLKDEFSQLQKALFETAQRIAAMQLEQVSSMLRRAIEAFEEGNLERANTLLDEIAHEAEHHMAQLESDRNIVHKDIEAFLLQAKTVIIDFNFSNSERNNKVAAIYAKADDWAHRSALPEEKYEVLLSEYGEFLCYHTFEYDKALFVMHRLASIRERLYGLNHPKTATSYHRIGDIYFDSEIDFNKALDFYSKALNIRERVLGAEHPDTATLYGSIGLTYDRLDNHNMAEEYYTKELKYYLEELSKYKNTRGKENLEIAQIYGNIGDAYRLLGNYEMELEYYFKRLAILEIVLGQEHPSIAGYYNNIGSVYRIHGDFNNALKFCLKSLNLRKKVLGLYHPHTARAYVSIGYTYDCLSDYDKALECFFKALTISKKVLGPENPYTKLTQENIDAIKLKMEQ